MEGDLTGSCMSSEPIYVTDRVRKEGRFWSKVAAYEDQYRTFKRHL